MSAICEELELHPTVFYEWQRRFFENGVKAFESEEKQESKQLRDKVTPLRLSSSGRTLPWQSS
jgi:transposase-like protein